MLREAPAPPASLVDNIPAPESSPGIGSDFAPEVVAKQDAVVVFALEGIAGTLVPAAAPPDTDSGWFARLDAIPAETPESLFGLSVVLFLIGILGQGAIENWRLQTQAARSRTRY